MVIYADGTAASPLAVSSSALPASTCPVIGDVGEVGYNDEAVHSAWKGRLTAEAGYLSYLRAKNLSIGCASP